MYAGEVEGADEWAVAVARAAEDLAERLRALADRLAAQRNSTRIPYGSGLVGDWFRRRSPKGFVLDSVSRQMLLPDGRLWSYSRADASRFPAGRFYDARADYDRFVGSRFFPGGREFVFLGANLSKYSFGVAGAEVAERDESSGLCAIYGEGPSVRYVAPDDAFAAIAANAATPGPLNVRS